MVELSIKLAKQQLQDGSASPSVITHFLKLGTERDLLEKEKLRGENKLLEAKVDAIKSAKTNEELYRKAIEAMHRYSGGSPDDIGP